MGLFCFMSIIFPLAIAVGLLLPIIAIIDIMKNNFQGNDKILYALIVIFIPLGAIIYFIIAPSKKIGSN